MRMTAEGRRAAILRAAMKLFSERGFRGTTTRALAEEVGVTEPVLYEHFTSKRELYTALVDKESSDQMDRAKTLLEPLAAAKDDRAVFLGLGEFILRSYGENRSYSRLLLSVALDDPELGQICFDRQREARERVASYISERIEDGVFRPVDPIVAARAFLAMVSHYGMTGMLYRDNFITGTEQQVLEQMVDLFLRGISK
jgi:AcrR family transcriptional regulator